MNYTPRDHVNQSGQMLLRFAAEYKRRTANIAGLIEAHLSEQAFGQVRELATWRRAELERINGELVGHEQGLVGHIEAGETDG